MSDKPFTVLVCGGRTFADLPKRTDPEYRAKLKELHFVHKTLYSLVFEKTGTPNDTELMPVVRIINGGAKGADEASTEWALINWTGLQIFEADWEQHGKAAGHIRNARMLDEGQPDLVVAFPGGKGTADMVKQAKKAGVEVMEIEYADV